MGPLGLLTLNYTHFTHSTKTVASYEAVNATAASWPAGHGGPTVTAAGAQQFVPTTGGRNNLPYMHGTTGAQVMTAAHSPVAPGASRTVITVMRMASDATEMALCGFRSTLPIQSFGLGFREYVGSTPAFYTNDTDGTNSSQTYQYPDLTSGPVIIADSFDVGIPAPRRSFNGNQVGVAAVINPACISDTGADGFAVGGRSDNQTSGVRGDFYEQWFYSPALTDAEIASEVGFFSSKYSIPIVTNSSLRKKLVCIGDSITVGVGATDNSHSYPARILALLGASTWDVPNIGIGGLTCAQLVTTAPANIQPLFKDTSAANICNILIGTNDLFLGRSADDIYADTVTVVGIIAGYGFSPLLDTVLARFDAAWTPAMETQRLLLNAQIMANADGAQYIPVDTASQSFDTGPDGIHLTNLGYDELATYVEPFAATAATLVVVSSSTPAYGPPGTFIVIKGANFTGANSGGTTVGGVALDNFVLVDSTTIKGNVGTHTDGAVDIVVTATAGTGTGKYLFQYGFSPEQLPETKFWVRSFSRVVRSGGKVYKWFNLIDNSVITDVEQLTASKRPVYSAAGGPHGLPAIQGSVANHTSLASILRLLPAGVSRTIFAVSKANSAVGGVLVECQTSAGGKFQCNELIIGGNLFGYSNGTGNATRAGAPVITGVTVTSWEGVVGLDPVMKVNGVDQGLTGQVVTTDNGTDGFSVMGTSGFEFEGDGYEFVVCSPALNPADEASMTTYLTTTWV